MNENKVVLITGASSGMGKEAAKLFAQERFRVFAGARNIEKMKEFKPLGIIPLKMDVSKFADNKAAINKIIAEEKRIDVLVNNAGFGLYGPVEEIFLEDARYQFDVNLFGLAELTQLVLPYMRKQKSGRIINISSMGGKIYTPLGAWYHATKHAIEGFSDCLRIEVEPFGINVSIIEPGAIRTNFGEVVGKQLTKYIEKGSAYKQQIEPFIKLMNSPRMQTMGTDAKFLAKVFLKAATEKKPKRRYVKGQMAKPMLFIRKWFGDAAFELLLKRSFGRN